MTLAFTVRNYFPLLEYHNIKGEEFAVASALLLGCTDYLDADQIREYPVQEPCISSVFQGCMWVSFIFF